MKQSGYQTKQKKQILDYLIAHSSRHITAQELTRQLNEEGFSVGTATVYRCLEQLADQGILRKYTIDARSGSCYEYVPDPCGCREHFHLKCTCCDTLYHVTCEQLDALGVHVLEHHGFAIDQTKTVLYGVCARCRGEKS